MGVVCVSSGRASEFMYRISFTTIREYPKNK